MSKMTRITDLTKKQLDELAAETGKTKQYLMEKAVSRLRRDNFLRKANLAYEQMTDEQKRLYQAEVKEWDVTLADGLEPYE